MAELIAVTLLLCVLAAPLVFGLQRFGVFRPPLWQVLLACLAIAIVLVLAMGDEASYRIGYFIALPLFAAGAIVLGASFLKGTAKPVTESLGESSRALKTESKKCPYCAELIQAEATVCRYCKRELMVAPQPTPSAPASSADFESLKRLAGLSESDRRKNCWACAGEIPSCVICKAREEQVKEFLGAWH